MKSLPTNGWDVLAALLVVFGSARLTLEHDRYRGLVSTLVFSALLVGLLARPFMSSPRRRTLLNVFIFVLVATYMPIHYFGPAVGFTWPALLTLAACATFAGRWIEYLEVPTARSPDRGFPRALRVQRVVPLIAAGVGIYGMALALPPGPLSDEGMALFMEGGCDWGDSNVFFFAKLGLLVGVNACMTIALREQVTRTSRFLPHLGVAAALAVVWWNDTSCDHYWYGHPQGNLAQMIVETMALVGLMIAFLPRLHAVTVRKRALGIVAMNTWHVAAFYAGLPLFAHWTWAHTWMTVTLTLAPACLMLMKRWRIRPRNKFRLLG